MSKTIAFSRIYALGADRVEQLKRCLREDGSTAAIELVHHQWAEMGDLAPETLRRQLLRFRARVVMPEARRDMAAAAGKAIANRLQLNGLEELLNLAEVQKRRLQKILQHEHKGPLLAKLVSEEIRLMADILDDIARIQLETGALQRAPRPVAVAVGQVSQLDPDDMIQLDPTLAVIRWTEEDDRFLKEMEGEYERLVEERAAQLVEERTPRLIEERTPPPPKGKPN